MALKKLSITEEQADKVRELLGKGLSPYKISEITGIAQPTLWRNMEFMGLNKKREKQQTIIKVKFFSWNHFKNKCII